MEYMEKVFSVRFRRVTSRSPGFGRVSLTAAGWNKSRIDQGVARHLLHHNYELPVGEIRSAWFEEGSPGLFKARSAIPLFPESERVEYIAEYLRLLEHTPFVGLDQRGIQHRPPGAGGARRDLVPRRLDNVLFDAAWTSCGGRASHGDQGVPVQVADASGQLDGFQGVERSAGGWARQGAEG